MKELTLRDHVILKEEDIVQVTYNSTFKNYCSGRTCRTCPFYPTDDDCSDIFWEAKRKIESEFKKFADCDTVKEKKYDFYIAAPFFNPDQVTRVELVKALLDTKSKSYFSPKDDSAVEDINIVENRKKVFKLNHNSIDESRAVIAITDGKDVGTIWEAGYAYAKNIPVIYIAFTLGKDGQFNLMLSESGVAACRTVEELKEAIDGKMIYFEGNIE